jgi:hypothetical protein
MLPTLLTGALAKGCSCSKLPMPAALATSCPCYKLLAAHAATSCWLLMLLQAAAVDAAIDAEIDAAINHC